jgi:hypothetical protein
LDLSNSSEKEAWFGRCHCFVEGLDRDKMLFPIAKWVKLAFLVDWGTGGFLANSSASTGILLASG